MLPPPCLPPLSEQPTIVRSLATATDAITHDHPTYRVTVAPHRMGLQMLYVRPCKRPCMNTICTIILDQLRASGSHSAASSCKRQMRVKPSSDDADN